MLAIWFSVYKGLWNQKYVVNVFDTSVNKGSMFDTFPTGKAVIYLKDSTAQNFVIAQNSWFSANNVLIK